jgi:transcriptional regulator with XRE-family HTH domain
MNETSWSRYVKRTSRNASGSEIEAVTGIGQSTVSRWLVSATLPSPAHAAKFAHSYGGNVLEAFVAAGFLTEEEAGIPPREEEPDFYAIVDEDPGLSDNAKIHLKNQYGLLRSASAHDRAAESIQTDPELDDETKERLLSRLDAAQVTTVFSSSATVIEHPGPTRSS